LSPSLDKTLEIGKIIETFNNSTREVEIDIYELGKWLVLENGGSYTGPCFSLGSHIIV